MPRKRETQSDFLTTIVTALGRGLWLLISWPFRGMLSRRSRLNQTKYQTEWQQIRTLANGSENHQQTQAIFEADKLFDQALRELGTAGNTFGERLRAAEFRFSKESYQQIWEAHKIRNQLAHEVGFQVSKTQVNESLAYFQQGLRILGAL